MKDEEEIKYTIYSYKNVPVIVNFNNIKETYVNPTKSADSFIVNDYYSSKKETLESIGNQ
ncbi:MAG: hypothetical protein MJ233_02870 [Mycoplasmoidaceae bacterium]|nr:hypothetical protein [Mycoplasmoidaceae bacterium]